MGQMVRQAPLGSDEVGTVLATIWSLLGGVFGLVTILIITFYFLVEADAFFDVFIRLVPPSGRRRVRAVVAVITEKVSAWLVGQLILAGSIGVTSAIGLLLLGVPYFYVLAVINAVGELVPYLGPIVAALPAIAVAATVSWKLAVFTALYYFLQQQFEAYVLAPRIMEQQVGLSPAVVIVALLLGGAMMGVVGAVLAVPTAAILHVLVVAVVPTTAEE
jgi:predicted PurR-regulated permease PerM